MNISGFLFVFHEVFCKETTVDTLLHAPKRCADTCYLSRRNPWIFLFIKDTYFIKRGSQDTTNGTMGHLFAIILHKLLDWLSIGLSFRWYNFKSENKFLGSTKNFSP